MTEEQITIQLWALEEVTKRALQSKEYALKYLEEAGILKILDDVAAASSPVKDKKKKKK
jgi:hypothetical protein